MKTLEWNMRTIITVGFALLLTATVGIMGVWLLLSGQPGTGMMESGEHTQMMESGDMTGMIDGTAMPDGIMGAPADRGIFGGYTGAIGLVMIVLFVSMVGLLAYALLRERPGQPQPAICWNCERPVETDWTSCPYCGASLLKGRQLPQTENAP